MEFVGEGNKEKVQRFSVSTGYAPLVGADIICLANSENMEFL